MLLCAALTPAAQADSIVSEADGVQGVAAYGGRVVWSEQARLGGRWRLRTRFRGRVTTVRIRSRAMPFDVNLGPDARGRTVAVYSRCGSEPAGTGRHADARGCDLYRYEFATRRERRVRGPSSRAASEYMPAIWGSRLAFVRIYERRRGVRSALPHIYVRDLRTGRTVRLRAGARGRYLRGGPREGREWFGGAGPTSLDLRRRSLAVGWQLMTPRCGRRSDPGLIDRSEVWLLSVGGSRRRVAVGCDARVHGPVLDGRFLYYVSDFTSTLSRFDPRSAARAAARPEHGMLSLARDGGATYYASSGPSGSAAIYEADGLRFTPVP